ncbi:MAG: TolC family protein [Verrucomicrobia bacterium]|nr:TolC family protein [Verrucomicrobiota bacterium]
MKKPTKKTPPPAADNSAFGSPASGGRVRHSPFRHCPRRRTARRIGLFVGAFALAFAGRAAAETPAVSLSNPVSLDAAIRLALQRNQDLKVSSFAPDIARANVLAESGRFDPALTFRRTYAESESAVTRSPLVTSLIKEDDYSLSLGGLAPWGLTYSLTATANNQRGTANRFTDNFVTFGGVSVTQPLLRGFGLGANLASLRIAKADRSISDWQHKATVINVVTNVVVVYNNLVQARENVRIARLSRDLTAQLVDQNEKRNRIGQISDADVLQARARLASREETVLFALRAAEDTQNQLRQLIGDIAFANPGAALDLTELPAPAAVTVNLADDLKRAYDQRPDYQAARLGVTKHRASSAFAQNQLLPRVDLTGSYGYSGLDRDFATARRQVVDSNVRAYSTGLVVSVPLTFAEGRGRARAAKLGLRQSEADLVRLEQDIAVDVTAAAGQVETTRQRVAVARTALDLAEQSLAAEQKKFTAGTSSTFLVLQSQDQLTQVQSSHARALADQRRALANYDRELGRTLATWQITLP